MVKMEAFLIRDPAIVAEAQTIGLDKNGGILHFIVCKLYLNKKESRKLGPEILKSTAGDFTIHRA